MSLIGIRDMKCAGRGSDGSDADQTYVMEYQDEMVRGGNCKRVVQTGAGVLCL